MKKFDVIIFGGGPAGASAAIALLQKGYSVAVIEKTDYTNFRTGETLPPKINQAISSLSIKNLFKEQLPVNANLSCWGSACLLENNFFSNPFGNGWHVNRNSFDRSLIDHAKNSGCHLFTESTIENITQHFSNDWHITIKQTGRNYTLTGRFAIDASGRNAVLVKKMQGRRINHDHLVAVSAVQENSLPKNTSNYTLIEAVESGWWYAADLPGNAIVFNYMTDADLYKAALKKDKNVFQKKMAETKFIKERAGKPITTHLSSANTFIMDNQFGGNWLAVGDAAMAYDPLSASGILKAVNDGIRVANTINNYFSGDKHCLKNFADKNITKYQNYLRSKALYYNLETRWLASLFWKRRTYETVLVSGI